MSASASAAAAAAAAAPDMASLYPPSVKFIPDLDIPVVSYGGDTSQFLSSNFPMTEIIPGLYSVTIPRGTLLYHSADIPEQPASDASINEKLAYVIKLLKGTTPYGTRATYSESYNRQITLSGCHDQFNFRFFFFSVFPTIEFAITNNYIIEYETKHDIKLAITMSPSRFTKKGGWEDQRQTGQYSVRADLYIKKLIKVKNVLTPNNMVLIPFLHWNFFRVMAFQGKSRFQMKNQIKTKLKNIPVRTYGVI
jgi:hypothetical protein